MILFKVDAEEKCHDVKIKVECENEELFIAQLTSLLLAIGHDHKLRKAFMQAIDVAEIMITED